MIQDLLPAKVRRIIYILVGTVMGLEAILDLIPAGVESKVWGVLGVLGFGLAAGNTNTTPTNEGEG